MKEQGNKQEQERLTVQEWSMFLGAEMRCQQKGHKYQDFEISFKNIDYFINSPFSNYYEPKPILRPLSIKEKKGIKDSTMSLSDLLYLIKDHADVFGWIEKGLAIDKTTIKIN